MVAGLFGSAARWCAGPLSDPTTAKAFAQKAIDLGVSNERLLSMLKEILAEQ